MLVVIVPLAFAAASSATIVVPVFNTADGQITSLTRSEVTVQANAEVPTSCAKTSASPALAGFKVGEQVTIACTQGVLASITKGPPRLGPDIPIPGLSESFGGALPVSGPRPTQEQCAAAWNKNAPLAAQQAVGALAPLAVQVGVGAGGVISPPPTMHTIASGPICSISFALTGARTAEVSSVWKHGTAQNWRGFIKRGYPAPLHDITQAGFTISASGTLSHPR
jgi:hypothetical protein